MVVLKTSKALLAAQASVDRGADELRRHRRPPRDRRGARAVRGRRRDRGGRAEQGDLRVRSHRHFRKIGTEHVSESGMKWMRGGIHTKRPRDRTLGDLQAAAAGERHRVLPDRLGPGPPGASHAPSTFSTVNRFCVAVLYWRAGRLAAENGEFRPG